MMKKSVSKGIRYEFEPIKHGYINNQYSAGEHNVGTELVEKEAVKSVVNTIRDIGINIKLTDLSEPDNELADKIRQDILAKLRQDTQKLSNEISAPEHLSNTSVIELFKECVGVGRVNNELYFMLNTNSGWIKYDSNKYKRFFTVASRNTNPFVSDKDVDFIIDTLSKEAREIVL